MSLINSNLIDMVRSIVQDRDFRDVLAENESISIAWDSLQEIVQAYNAESALINREIYNKKYKMDFDQKLTDLKILLKLYKDYSDDEE